MSPAQWLVAGIGATLSIATFMLLRHPRYRRDQFRGEPASLAWSLAAAALMAGVGILFVWTQGRFEAP
jgi:hypothetical protein